MDGTEALVEQLDREKRSVSYDAYDITVRQLLDMVANGEIEIAPEYQRHFVWDEARESELIESIFLGIPVPSLFMATNKDGSWEVVDGVQRLSTLIHFAGEEDRLELIGRKNPLVLQSLSKLSALNGKTYKSIPKSVQLNFSLRPLRVTTLNDKSDLNVRYELFERLNTGGVLLHPQEIRNCVFRGKLRTQIRDLAENDDFRAVVLVRDSEQRQAIYEECVLRFFAFLDRYGKFEHLVAKFLNDYAKDHNEKGAGPLRVKLFKEVMSLLRQELPDGIYRGRRSITPVNLYEGIAVGTALILGAGDKPKKGALKKLLQDEKLAKLTQGGTNTRSMVAGRIEYVRDALS